MTVYAHDQSFTHNVTYSVYCCVYCIIGGCHGRFDFRDGLNKEWIDMFIITSPHIWQITDNRWLWRHASTLGQCDVTAALKGTSVAAAHALFHCFIAPCLLTFSVSKHQFATLKYFSTICWILLLQSLDLSARIQLQIYCFNCLISCGGLIVG